MNINRDDQANYLVSSEFSDPDDNDVQTISKPPEYEHKDPGIFFTVLSLFFA